MTHRQMWGVDTKCGRESSEEDVAHIDIRRLIAVFGRHSVPVISA